MHAYQFAKALHVAERNGWTKFVSMQNHYNLIYREEEREMIPLCVSEGLGVIPWSPLARGLLTRPREKSKGETTRSTTHTVSDRLYTNVDWGVVDAVETVAKARGISMAQVGLAWLLSKPAVTAPIVGATKPKHLEDAVAALDVSLTAEEIAALESPYRPKAFSA
jgi:aryl-alcohol dehydrogenase-like predicted oxidoreductase